MACRGGACPFREPPRHRRPGGMRASRPTFARLAAAAPFSRAFAAVRRGGPWSSRKPRPAARPPGRCKHRPLQRSPRGEVVASGLAAGSALIRRGGIHPTRKTLRQCGFAVGRGVLPGTVGRAFTPAAPQRFKTGVFAPPQGPAGWGIPPYVRPEGRGCPAWPVACHGV